MSVNIDRTKKERRILRGRSTKLSNKLSIIYIDTLDLSEVQAYEGQVEQIIIDLYKLDKPIIDDLMVNESDEDIISQEESDTADYALKLNCCLNRVKIKINSLSTTSAVNALSGLTGSGVQSDPRKNLKLGHLILPKFYANKEKDTHTCQSFINSFEQLVSGYHLNDQALYCTLVEQCEGRAKQMVESLTLLQRSYTAAKDILFKSFAEEIPQKFSVIQKFTELALKNNGDPYIFYAEFTKLIETVKEDKIDLDNFMQYFIWNALPTNMKDMVISISQKSYPLLRDIRESFLPASSRFEDHKNTTKNFVVASNALSLKTNPSTKLSSYDFTSKRRNFESNKKLYCYFCQNTSHYSGKCLKYNTIQGKKDRINELGLCWKCLKAGHNKQSCTFILKGSCNKCSKKHWSFLCDSRSGSQSSNVKSSANVVVTNESIGDSLEL